MPIWLRFGYGAFGAAAPEVIRIFGLVSRQVPGRVPPFGFAYCLFSLLLMAVGGGLAAAWGDPAPLKCIWVGVSAPTIISTLAAQAPGIGSSLGASERTPAMHGPKRRRQATALR
jgi:hypothetical protein